MGPLISSDPVLVLGIRIPDDGLPLRRGGTPDKRDATKGAGEPMSCLLA